MIIIINIYVRHKHTKRKIKKYASFVELKSQGMIFVIVLLKSIEFKIFHLYVEDICYIFSLHIMIFYVNKIYEKINSFKS